MFGDTQICVYRRKTITVMQKARSYAFARMQSSEKTFILFCNKFAGSVVDEANTQDRRTRKGSSFWKPPKPET